jgi:hypothetical protein
MEGGSYDKFVVHFHVYPYLICHRRIKVDPPAGEKRTRLIVILLALPTDFWTRPIAFLFA